MELRGVSCLDLERDTPDRKSIMASRSFGRSVTTLDEMAEAVASYAARAAEKLRRRRLATAHVVTLIETNRFKPDEAHHYATRPVRLPVATSDTAKLMAEAQDGLRAVWRPGFRYKKAGCYCSISIPPPRCRKACSPRPTIRAARRSCARSTRSKVATGGTR